MIENILIWLAAIIAVEAATEIEVNSELFKGFRGNIVRVKWVGWYLNGLFSCGYCLSVWVAALSALIIPGDVVVWVSSAVLGKITTCQVPFTIADFIIKTLVIHRLSNVVHEGIYRWLARMPIILGLRPIEIESDILDIGADDDHRTAENRGQTDQERSGTQGDAEELHAGE
jgi:hypothetical protein